MVMGAWDVRNVFPVGANEEQGGCGLLLGENGDKMGTLW